MLILPQRWAPLGLMILGARGTGNHAHSDSTCVSDLVITNTRTAYATTTHPVYVDVTVPHYIDITINNTHTQVIEVCVTTTLSYTVSITETDLDTVTSTNTVPATVTTTNTVPTTVTTTNTVPVTVTTTDTVEVTETTTSTITTTVMSTKVDPCPSECSISAATVNFYFWPTNRPYSYPNTYYHSSLDYTFTSPSVYMLIPTAVGINNASMPTGPATTSWILPLDLEEVSTLEGTRTVQIELSDLGTNCPQTADPTAIATMVDPACDPILAAPRQVREWAWPCNACGRFGLFDPPYAVPTLTGGLVPTSTATVVPVPTSAPPPPPTSVPPPPPPSVTTSPPVDTSQVAPVPTTTPVTAAGPTIGVAGAAGLIAGAGMLAVLI